jgi:hypothetical protein
MVGDATVQPGEAVEQMVVERHQHAVGGDVDVGLDVAIPQGDGMGEGPDGVLRPLPGASSVGEGQGPWMVEERPPLAAGDFAHDLRKIDVR